MFGVVSYATEAEPGFDSWLESLVATLPQTYVIGRAQEWVAAVPGGQPGWPDRAGRALEDGARAIVVRAPLAVASQDLLQALATKAAGVGAGVWLDSSWCTHPLLRAQTLEVVDASMVLATIVDEHVDESSLLVQLIALARLGLAIVPEEGVSWSSGGYFLNAMLSGSRARVHLRGISTSSDPAAAHLRVLRGAAEWTASLPAPGLEAPALVASTDFNGRASPPMDHEPSSRSIWRTVASRLHSGKECCGGDLPDLLRATALLEAVT